MKATHVEQRSEEWLELVLAQVAALPYGVVQVVVHDGRVVQIERTEKLRLDKPEPRTPGTDFLPTGPPEAMTNTSKRTEPSEALLTMKSNEAIQSVGRYCEHLGNLRNHWSRASGRRVGELDVDNDAFPVYANPANSATKAFSRGVGLNWHLNRNVKVSVNYDQTDFKGGAATDLLRKGEKALFTRAQISF